MTPERLREIAGNCEDSSFVCSEQNAIELRRLADHLDACLNHSCWVWNRRIIEKIRSVVPCSPVLDEDLADRIDKSFSGRAELLEAANSIWRDRGLSTNEVANKLMNLIVNYCESEK
jgi:hypothetical protein